LKRSCREKRGTRRRSWTVIRCIRRRYWNVTSLTRRWNWIVTMTITHLILPRNRNNHSPVTNVALTGTLVLLLVCVLFE